MEATVYTQEHAEINGRNVWFYLINSPIGNIAVVDYEQSGLEIKRKLFDGDYDKAMRYYKSTCRKLLNNAA